MFRAVPLSLPSPLTHPANLFVLCPLGFIPFPSQVHRSLLLSLFLAPSIKSVLDFPTFTATLKKSIHYGIPPEFLVFCSGKSTEDNKAALPLMNSLHRLVDLGRDDINTNPHCTYSRANRPKLSSHLSSPSSHS